jgi:hypothetical protein
MAEKSRDNFWGGFLLGAIVGGATVAVVTAILSKNQEELDPENSDSVDGAEANNLPNQPEGDRIRQNLEQKIVQLNQAIDAVSQEMQGSSQKSANGNSASLPLKQDG